MSALRTRTAAKLAIAAAIAMPMGIVMAGSASAAGLPAVPAIPVVSDLVGGAAGNSIALPVVGDPTGAVGTVTGLVGGAGLGTGALDGVLAGTPAAGAADMVTAAAAGDPTDLLPTDLVPGGAGELLPLEGTLGTVTDTVDDTLKTVTDTVDDTLDTVVDTVDQTLDTVTDTLETVTDIVDNTLDRDVVTTVKDQGVKAANKPAKSENVASGALPHTGGNANATAMMLCAGLAVAGTGVTLVTRRRNGLGMHAAN